MSKQEFYIGQMADDLVNLTIAMCGKKEDKKPRFPKYLYDTMVNKILNTAFDIQEMVFVANCESVQSAIRKERQQQVIEKCVFLQHLIRITFDNRWISEKQRDRWQKLTNDLQWKVYNWMKADEKRR